MTTISTPETAAPMPPPTESTDKECSRCEGPLDTTGYPLWCKKCQSAYRREYQATRKQMSESRGFCAGVTAMRNFLAKQFAQYGAGSFSGTEIAALILQSKDPR